MGQPRWLFGLFGLFAGFGALAATIGVVMALHAPGGPATATGVVIDTPYTMMSRSGGYRAVVRYTTDRGQEITFTNQVRTGEPAYGVGERVPVRYDPGQPRRAVIDDLVERWTAPGLCGGIGGLMLLAGIGGSGWVRASRTRARRLRESGRRVRARVVTATPNRAIVSRGRPAWQVVVEWDDPGTGTARAEPSETVMFDPRGRLPEVLDVYLDPDGGRDYVVDLAPVRTARAAGR